MTDSTTVTEQLNTKKPTKVRKFWYVVTWVFLWPMIVLIPAGIAFLIGYAISYNVVGTDNPKQFIFMFNSAILIATFLLVVGLSIIKYLFKKGPLFIKSGGRVIGIYIWIGVLLAGGLMTATTQDIEAFKPPTSQDQSLMAILSSAGGNPELMKDVSFMYVDGYDDGRQAGEYQPVLTSDGKFSYGTMTVKRGQDPGYEKTVVAHEFMHHVWQAQLDDQTRHQLTSQLIALYGKDTWMQGRGQWHADKNMLEPTELFAFYCTEISDQYVSPPVLEQCGKYINRATLRMSR